jgi:cellulose synthase/poly-beta-1,6-N-acetylglucosamine synthase-like glycosyltransferase
MKVVPFRPVPERNVKRVFATTSRTRGVVAMLVLSTVATLLVCASVDLVFRLWALPDDRGPVELQPGQFDETAEATLFHLLDGPRKTCDGVQPSGVTVSAFVPADDLSARSAFLARCETVDRLFLEDLAFGVEAGTVFVLASDGWSADLAALGRPSFLMLTARFDTPDGSSAPLLPDPASRARLLRDLEAHWPAGPGLCLDLSGNSNISPDDVSTLLVALRPLARARGAPLCVVGAVDAAFMQNEAVIMAADLLVAKGFRDPGRLPLPLAPQPWFDAAVTRLIEKVPTERLVLALGTFGVQTEAATGRAEQVAYGTAMARTKAAGGTVSVDSVALNTVLAFEGQDGRPARIAMLDGLTFANQMSVLPPELALAVWPLGYEDPAIWSLLAGESWQTALARPVVLADQVLLSGTGPVALRVEAATEGLRDVAMDRETGRVLGLTYQILPSPHLVSRFDGNVPDAVLIVFDGLPPAEHMSDLLRNLAQHGVRSAFAVTASEIVSNRDAVRQVIAVGHSIVLTDIGDLAGSGAFAGLARLRDRAAVMALAVETNRRAILAETIGEPGILPTSSAEFATLLALQSQGRIRLPEGERVPRDPAQAALFAERVLSTVLMDGSQLVRFDLSEAAVSSTLATLPVILSELDKAGASFISPDDLARSVGGVAMYPANGLTTLRDRIYVWTLLKTDTVLAALFFLLLMLAIVRSTAFLILAHLRHPRDVIDPDWTPAVTIVIPAYDEGKVIETCIRSIFACHYPDLRVIVVDDGSQDDTSAVVASIAAIDSRVRLVRQRNSGKWAAANTALRQVQTKYFIVLDADSMLEPEAIRWIVQPFTDPDVGAVSGIVEVGNARNWLTACQNLEYLVSQNIQRRAFETFDGIFVVPGAIGAWSTDAVIKAGLFSGETITEDADLTLAVHRAGYRVVMAERARALTEAPEKMGAFMSQRLRWTLGMLQTSWKHRRAITEGRPVGIVSIIDAIWFSVLTTILSPIVDLIIVILLGVVATRLMTGHPFTDGSFTWLLVGYLGLTLIDVLNTLATFRFEKRFSLWLLLLTPLVRFGYRQLLYVATLRATWRAITGRLTDWNKLERSGAMNTKPPVKPGLPALRLTVPA